ncbi:MAG TPA: hypothetical protein ENK85_06115 [Saprospiraceae bacterium]|nr:hypothetical protein [Saprospiraceae bacterium]
MNIRIIPRNKLDIAKYDRCITQAICPMPYAFSAHLDVVAYHWKVIVLGDYEMVMPIAYNRKLLGAPQVYHPFYAQQLGAFGRFQRDVVVVKAMLAALSKFYVRVNMQMNSANPIPRLKGWSFRQRTNYELNLNQPYESIRKSYRKGHKSNIKSSQSMNYMDVELFSAAAFAKIMAALPTTVGLGQLMDLVALYGTEDIQVVRLNDGSIGAIGFFPKLSRFMEGPERIVYLVGHTTEAGRKAFSGHFMLDAIIRAHAGTRCVLDFEGSELPGVSSFFKGFGPIDVPYLLATR